MGEFRQKSKVTQVAAIQPIRIVLDSNFFGSKLLDSDSLVPLLNDLTHCGKIVILTTHVQADEIRRASCRLKALFDRLVMTWIPTSGAIWDISKWDAACWGDGVGDVRIGDIMTSNPKDAEDALIGITAAANADIFVTDDRELAKRIKAKGVALEVLRFEQFAERARLLAVGIDDV